MSDRLERLSAMAGLTAAIAMGVPALVSTAAGDDPVDGPLPLWWASYLVFLGAFYVEAWHQRRCPRWLTSSRLLITQVVAATIVYLFSAQYGWTGVLFVITAVGAAFTWTIRATTALVAAQSAVLLIGQLAANASTGQALISALAYTSFQAFAALMVHIARREAMARVELETAQAELRASSALLAESSRAAERLRIARDLHDVMGHQLTALSLELEVATHHTDGTGNDHVVRARDISKNLLGDVRATVGELRVPPEGLVGPLGALVDGIDKPAVTLRVVEDTALDQDRTMAVVRCVQEIVTNTLRHANAQHLWIEVTVTSDGVHVYARDDGNGASHVEPGHGLAGMRERLEQLGGTLQLLTEPGQGFSVTAKVPAA